MKSIITLLFTILITNTVISQSKNNIYFDQKTQIGKFHTIDELENLKKGELIKLYIRRTKEIINALPFIALSNKPGESLDDNGIKEDSDNLKILKKHHESTSEAFESTKDMIAQFIPYADTEKIVWSILYYEEVIKQMRIGVNGNF